VYQFIVRHKDFIGAVGGVFSSLGVVIALSFSIYSLTPKAKEPVIDLTVTKLREGEQRLVIYNGGNGPCVELKVSYKANQFDVVKHILNYKTSSVVDAKHDSKTGRISYPAQVLYPLGVCKGNECTIKAGFLAPGNVFPLSFFGKGSSKVSVQCSSIEESIEI
jgi:hypothetical protein